MTMRSGFIAFDVGNAEFVIAHHMHIRAQLAEILHQVVGKGVVVVDHQ
jgi:hypothetical protein